MGINLTNFLSSKSKNKKMIEFQDLDHIDGVSISTVSANLYKDPRDDLVMFYFRDGANHASVYTQSKIISENIKWNLNLKGNSIKALLVNTRNANAFTGKLGFKGIVQIAEELSKKLTIKMAEDEEKKNFVKPNEIRINSIKIIEINMKLFFIKLDLHNKSYINQEIIKERTEYKIAEVGEIRSTLLSTIKTPAL